MDRRTTGAFLYAGMDSNSQSSGFQPPPPGVGPIGPRSYDPPFPMQSRRPRGVGPMGPQCYVPPLPMQPRMPPGVGPMGPQCYVPPLPMQPCRPPGVGPMGPQSYAPPFPMQIHLVLAQQGQATLDSQQFCSVGHGISSRTVGMPSSQGQPLQFSQPRQQLPSRLGHPNIPQTQQIALHLNQHMPGLGGPGAPFSSSHSFASSSSGQQPNAPNVSSQFRPLSEMHAYGASHVTPVQVTGQQPSVTASTVPVTGQQPSVTASTDLITQTMQVSLITAEDIIGVGGANLISVHLTSGAYLTVSETEGIPEEMTVEITGTYSEVEKARHLIRECISAGARSFRRRGI